ncbi:metallophosphoesterase family protein [Natronolimnohabitans innermongolicus]|uniref:Phosphoesterase n=1 Tax=Natronolimnohabitans innermongolicus JCM 12255 TaxID=1227499 RepID=L9WNB4_9EURY|nr:metallophosphoesterase family protein [Natronolimnohabitans innermongolicus]ELY50882.1 phosphodiesterase, MJ0936 family protein [Natronolimnohabitans innermongolicus JCM 12255]
MRVGLISDVHGNMPALAAVLEEIPDVDEYVHAGDLVGYGPDPEAVIETFRDRDITSIQGNHDRAVLGDFHENFHDIPKSAAQWTTERLDDEDLAYLEELPVELELYDGRVRVAHGAPEKPNTYTYPEDFSESLLSDESILVLGHTHMQAKSKFDDGVVVNPGSVGLPRDGDWRAGYAVLDLDAERVDCHRVEYPRAEVQARIEEYGLPSELVGGLEHGELVFGRTKRSMQDSVE